MSDTSKRSISITLDVGEITSAIVSEAMRILRMDDEYASKPDVTIFIEDRGGSAALTGASITFKR
jgi:hypothetical protein